jgi:hypothetical protein
MSTPPYADDNGESESAPLNSDANVEDGRFSQPSPSIRSSDIMTRPRRSIYTLTRSEITKGLANRFVHSRMYICLYLGMAGLSVTTVILSLTEECPGLPFYILEVIVNTSMILEVGVRFVAFGKVCGVFVKRA